MGNKNTSSKSISRAPHPTNPSPSTPGPPTAITRDYFSKQYAPFDRSLCDEDARTVVLESMAKPPKSHRDKRCPVNLKFLEEHSKQVLVVKSQHFEELFAAAFAYQHPSADELIRPLGIVYKGQYFWDQYEASRVVFSQQQPPWHESDNPRKHQLALNWVQDVVSVFHSSHYVAEATQAFSLPGAPKFHPMIAEEAVETAMNQTASLSVYVSVWLSFNLRKGTRLYTQDQWEFKMFDGGFIGENLGFGMRFEVNQDETELSASSAVHRGNLRSLEYEESKTVSLEASSGLGLGTASIKCTPFRDLKIETSTKMQLGHDMSGLKTTVQLLWKGKDCGYPSQLLPQLLEAEGWSSVDKRPKLATNFCFSVMERFNDQRRHYLGPSSPIFQLFDFPYAEPVVSTCEAEGSVQVIAFHLTRPSSSSAVSGKISTDEETQIYRLWWKFGADGSLAEEKESLFAVVSKNMHVLYWVDGVESGVVAPPEHDGPQTWT
eukprot:TRINITY_DN3825_c0_g1_i1.p1 TRINITY_DN3825_c0_g1~~TRINITY_DN3825_c0_g1_i1.p1  ORF type:complete len:490 (-),score=61.19 TRINITY_DN3825_c0_g1_i1:58-1527(-)